MPHLLTAQEAAVLLRCSPATLRKLCRAKLLPTVRLSPRGPWLIDVAQVEARNASHETTT